MRLIGFDNRPDDRRLLYLRELLGWSCLVILGHFYFFYILDTSLEFYNGVF